MKRASESVFEALRRPSKLGRRRLRRFRRSFEDNALRMFSDALVDAPENFHTLSNANKALFERLQTPSNVFRRSFRCSSTLFGALESSQPPSDAFRRLQTRLWRSLQRQIVSSTLRSPSPFPMFLSILRGDFTFAYVCTGGMVCMHMRDGCINL